MYYKAPNNSLHFLDDAAFENLLPAGSVQITDEEAEAIRIANLPVVDPKVAIKSQIDQLESEQLLPRITREFMLAQFEADAKAANVDPTINTGYVKLKEFDTQIAGLRGQL